MPVNSSGINGVTFAGVGGSALSDRDRGLSNTNGPGGDVANNDMWRDFIFDDDRSAPSVLPGVNGMGVTITGLKPEQLFEVQFWAFDDSSNGGRTMSWNGLPNLLSFPSSPDPTSLNDYTVVFQAASDASGTLVLEGRIQEPLGPCCNVFVNGFQLTAIPEPSTIAFGLCGLGFLIARRHRVHQ